MSEKEESQNKSEPLVKTINREHTFDFSKQEYEEQSASWIKDHFFLGLSYKDIAIRDGTTPQNVFDRCKRYLNRKVNKKAQVRLSNSMYDELQKAFFQRALADVDFAKVLLKTVEDQRKLLGLDAPVEMKTEVKSENINIEVGSDEDLLKKAKSIMQTIGESDDSSDGTK